MISSGKVVSMAFSLKDQTGTVLDSADTQTPFAYLHGHQQILEKLEQSLEGLKVGDKKTITLSPKEGYGEFDATLQFKVGKEQFPPKVNIQQGMQFEGPSPKDGNHIVLTVTQVAGNDVHLDGNHPLAGKTLTFEVEVVEVRNPTQEELDHGHVHGPGGHHH